MKLKGQGGGKAAATWLVSRLNLCGGSALASTCTDLQNIVALPPASTLAPASPLSPIYARKTKMPGAKVQFGMVPDAEGHVQGTKCKVPSTK